MGTSASSDLPIGETVKNIDPSPIPPKKIYAGKFVKLHPIEPENDIDELFLNSHGSVAKERIWTYMSYGPFSNKVEMHNWLEGCQAAIDITGNQG